MGAAAEEAEAAEAEEAAEAANKHLHQVSVVRLVQPKPANGRTVIEKYNIESEEIEMAYLQQKT